MNQGKNTTSKSAVSTPANGKAARGFAEEEKAAMKQRAKELKAEENRANGEEALLASIAEMGEPDRSMIKRLHEIISTSAPALMPKTWYGMPAYADADGKVVCFLQTAQKFKTRYATLGFSDTAHLDEGTMWPTSYALKELTPADESRISALVKKAVS